MGFNEPGFVEIYEQLDGQRTEDIAFYLEAARKADGPILDAGCGSGRIMIPMLREGLEVEGFDPSQAMLDRFPLLDPKLVIWRDSLETFSAPRTDYSLILSAFNSFLHLLTQEDQLAALRNIHDHLKPGGGFIFDIINPYTLDIYDTRATKQFEATFDDATTGKSVSVWRWFTYDVINQRGEYFREFVIDGGAPQAYKTQYRWTYPQEMRLLLQIAGFTDLQSLGDFKGQELTEEATSQVWIARKI